MAKHKTRSREALSWLNKAFLQAGSSPWAASLCVGPKQTQKDGEEEWQEPRLLSQKEQCGTQCVCGGWVLERKGWEC